MSAPKTNEIPKAERLARAIASDLSIYYQKKIQEGLENDTFFDTLAEELEEARSLFKAKVADELVEHHNILERSIIDIIVASRAHIATKIF